jgi:hypothetical protein
MSRFLPALALAITLTLTPLAHAAKTYQVTGTITKLTDKIITLEKSDGEKWELDRDDQTKITGNLKVGAKVTIEYKMTATKVEVKPSK